MGMYIGVNTMKNSVEGSQKIKNESVLWSIDSTFGYVFKETQNIHWK